VALTTADENLQQKIVFEGLSFSCGSLVCCIVSLFHRGWSFWSCCNKQLLSWKLFLSDLLRNGVVAYEVRFA